MTVSELPKRFDPYVRALLDKRFVLKHKGRGAKRWVKIGVYPDLDAAMEEMEKRMAGGKTGNWKVEKLTKFPKE